MALDDHGSVRCLHVTTRKAADEMTLSNPRWLIDGAPATSFAYGRKAEMVVDVTNVSAGASLVFRLSTGSPCLLAKVTAACTSAGPVAATSRSG